MDALISYYVAIHLLILTSVDSLQRFDVSRKTDTACEGKSLSLSCEKGKRLFINNVLYGWDGLIPQACTKPNLKEKPQSCLSSTAEQIVKEKCHNKRVCTVYANEETFGPGICPGIGKYLKTSYVCIPKKYFNADGSFSDDDEQVNDGSEGGKEVLIVDMNNRYNNNLEDSGDDCNCTSGGQPVYPDHKHSPSDPNLVFGWVHSLAYLHENHEKLILYMMLCACLAFISALVALLVKVFYTRHRQRQRLHHSHKLNVTEPNQDVSNEENTYVAAADPSDMAMLQYNLGYGNRELPNRLTNNTSGSYHRLGTNNRFNQEPETIRFNTNSLTVANPLQADSRRNFNTSPHTTASTALNNSPAAATVSMDNRNTFYENSADDEHTNDDNDAIASTSHTIYPRPGSAPDSRTRNNSLFDRHS